MKKFKQIRTKEVIRWLSPENRMVTLHKIAYQGLHYCGYVESWDNIDKKSVLVGIAYGNSKIKSSNVIGVIGHGVVIEGSYIHFPDGFCISELADVSPSLYSNKYYDVQHVNLECAHIKNTVMWASPTRYHVTFAPVQWNVLSECGLDYFDGRGLDEFTVKQMWRAPEFFGLAIGDGTAVPNSPVTLIHHMHTNVEDKYYTYRTGEVTGVSDHFKTVKDRTKMFAEDVSFINLNQ